MRAYYRRAARIIIYQNSVISQTSSAIIGVIIGVSVAWHGAIIS